ncbi:magnesium-translocating P-type ATPase [Amnibacterium kyonggiense]|uniref:Magnesium-transporting ATPase, P-type 1 n=1 Tax=Amnibacterium kyonggiense TaxID=595671 RepID=A0A4R7FKK5_9MICO|nr:magnesium-translocating P-type ATPase [Amnibacterium kyonggiense]TDS76878.1 Mg2+-importing ATPase [Amnibacterium kyonggiense]
MADVTGTRPARPVPAVTRTAPALPRELTPGELDLVTAARLPADAVLARVRSRPTGLTTAEAGERRTAAGPNLVHARRVRWWAVLGAQFRNPLVVLLIVCAAVAGVTGDPTAMTIILVIVAVSAGLGFVNEFRAELAVAALHARISRRAVVWRDGAPVALDVTALVPGDVVDLRVGDLVPADLRLLATTTLECDEALLTGESASAGKTAAASPEASGLDLPCCALMGTIVHTGGGRGVVTAIGRGTAFGAIAAGLAEQSPRTAFQAGLSAFSRFLVGIAAILTVGIFVVNAAFGRPIIDALLFSLAIAVGITPEMMPAIVTVSLSAGSRRLAAQKVLVKRLVAIEDLGDIRTLFTDKTGTLTEGRTTFAEALDPSGAPDPGLLRWGLLCTESTPGPTGPVGGNDLDQALWRAPRADDPTASFRRDAMLPFDHERQLASTAVTGPDGQRVLVTKGAPEAVLRRCAAVDPAAEETLRRLFAAGARVVAVASRPLPGPTAELAVADETGLRLLGFLTFVDRPKADAGAAIRRLAGLEVDVKLVTGDNGTVAEAVCAELGVPVTGVLTGAELDALDDARLAALIQATTVFARVTPVQKARIVKTARVHGGVVAFLGDGVNDAVALHHADVGISVDGATDVAKDAADVVLLEKDLDVLADGVTEGRRIFANTMKFVFMATSSNFGNMFSAAGASLFLPFLPMLPSQILLNNLLYNGGQLAIPTDRTDPEVLARPAAWDIRFIRRFMLLFGPISSVFDFLTFGVMLLLLHAGPPEFRTGWFIESLATQTLVIYVIRTRRVPFLRSRPSVPMLVVPLLTAGVGVLLPFTPIGGVLGFSVVPAPYFLALLAMIGAYLALAELAKRWFYAAGHGPRQAPPRSFVQRWERRVQRRAAVFVRHSRHPAPGTLPG